MSKAYKCDVCGNITEGESKDNFPNVAHPSTFNATLDTCPECHDAYKKWLDSRKRPEPAGFPYSRNLQMEPCPENNQWSVVDTTTGQTIVVTSKEITDRARTYARLFASAPQLLDAARILMATLNHPMTLFDVVEQQKSSLWRVLHKLHDLYAID